MKVLVYLEQRAGRPRRASLAVVSKAAAIGGEVAALVVGDDLGEVAAEAGRHGAQTLFVADDQRLADGLPQPQVDVLAELVATEGFDTVLFGDSLLARDIAAGLAARLGAGLNWDLVDLELREGALVGTCAALDDTVRAEVGWRSAVRLGLFRVGACEPVERGVTAAVRSASFHAQAHSLLVRVVEPAAGAPERRSIDDAPVVVAGGRGVGGREGFARLEALAEALGGAVAATGPAVEAGWWPYAGQVGQTGKTVAPGLYLALGISGAFQHVVGMKRSATIVAINSDPHAPIFGIADLGVVGDLEAILPRLVALVDERRSA